jgi:hypothetical protein
MSIRRTIFAEQAQASAKRSKLTKGSKKFFEEQIHRIQADLRVFEPFERFVVVCAVDSEGACRPPQPKGLR